MIGLDTNLLVRIVVRDDQRQTQLAIQKLREGQQPYFVSILVLLEWFWVLEKIYRIETKQILAELHLLLQNEALFFENHELIEQSVRLNALHKANFIDILIGLRNREAGCETTFTFDKAASMLDSFTQLA